MQRLIDISSIDKPAAIPKAVILYESNITTNTSKMIGIIIPVTNNDTIVFVVILHSSLLTIFKSPACQVKRSIRSGLILECIFFFEAAIISAPPIAS